MKTFIQIQFIVLGLLFSHFDTAAAVQKVNRCSAWYGAEGKSSLRESVINTPEGKTIIAKAENPTLDLPTNLPLKIKSFMEFLVARTGEQVAALKQQLTRVFSEDKAGSFAVKDENGKSKPFYVPTNPIPLPIPRSYHERLVRSTQALFKSKNDLLQIFYSKKSVTIEDLRQVAVKGTPDAILQDVINYVKGNLYFEKGAIHSAMKDYRFISVVGIDHALTTVNQMKALGFEFNGGTPSGASNTRSIIEAYKKVLPQFSEMFDSLLAADTTFRDFKTTMDRHGRHWTKNENGISVVVSPGRSNGAHPDVVTIAEQSGMPLVKMEDLYIDKNGNLRLNQPNVSSANHPTVTSIYSRHEESALFSATNPNRDLGFKIPRKYTAVEKENLRQKGLEVQEGISYEFIENDKGEIIDIHRDQYGKPKKFVFDNVRLGKDPTLKPGEQGHPWDLLDLRNKKKLYISNMGGRTLDIKPLFDIIGKYFAPNHSNGEPVFSPPPTLELNDPIISDSEYQKFYANPKKYVVKVADDSGGNGVDVVSQKSEAEIKKIEEKVRQDQMRVKMARQNGDDSAVAQYTIQEFVNSAVITTAVYKNGKYELATVIPDLRLFVLMSPEGEVSAGTMAYLGRNGVHGSAISNTSKGGEYFIPLVYEDRVGVKPETKQLVPEITKPRNMTQSDSEAAKLFLWSLGEMLHVHKQFNSQDPRYLAYLNVEKWNKFSRLTDQYRDAMHLLGPEFRPFQSLFDRRNSGEIDDITFRTELSKMADKVKSVPQHQWLYPETAEKVRYWLVDWTVFDFGKVGY